MKKTLMVLFCMIFAMSFLILTGCGGSSDSGDSGDSGSGDAPAADSAYIGTWQVTSASFQDEEITGEDMPQFTLELRDDGTATLTDGEDASDGNWTETSNGVKVKGDDINMEFKDKDGGLECSVLGVHMFLEKQ